jgi:hypothetical protein
VALYFDSLVYSKLEIEAIDPSLSTADKLTAKNAIFEFYIFNTTNIAALGALAAQDCTYMTEEVYLFVIERWQSYGGIMPFVLSLV